MASLSIPSIRISPDRAAVGANLGFLAELSGTWEGQGFNLIARPDKQGGSPLFLELNQTFETLSFIPISSSIPNRGDVVDDIELFGLTYLQKVSDSVTGGALHIEPGIWIHIPSEDTDGGKTQSVARMGNIPHGNSLLAQGTAIKLDPFTGNPFNPDAISARNTAPFPVGDPMPFPGTLSGFPPYDLSNLTPACSQLQNARWKRAGHSTAEHDFRRPHAGRHSGSDEASDSGTVRSNDRNHGGDQYRDRRQPAAGAARPRWATRAAAYYHYIQWWWRRHREHSVPPKER